MPFSSLFGRRRKEDEIAATSTIMFLELHEKVIKATINSTFATENVLRDKLETTLDPSARWDLLCEIYCFYSHILDYFSFGVLGEQGRDIVVDGIVPAAIVPLVHAAFPHADDEIREPLIADLLERVNVMTFEYSESREIFVSDFQQVLQQGGIPGVNDTISDRPEAKVSRLIQNVDGTLQDYIPDFGLNSKFVRQGMDAFGSDSPEFYRLVLLCGAIQNSIFQELNEATLLEHLRKIRSLIQ